MRNLTLNDNTQIAIIRHLQDTERLLAQVASKFQTKKKQPTSHRWRTWDCHLM